MRKLLLSLAFMALASGARGALVTFDVSGIGTVNTVSSFAADPSQPPGTTGIDASFGPYFITHFSPGSSITIETDRNGNGLTNDWRLVSGTLEVDGTLRIGALGSILIDETISLSGGEGTLSGNEVLWSHYALTEWSATGTWQCLGAGLCGLIGIPEGYTAPIAMLDEIMGLTKYDPVYLGIWELDASNSAILGSSKAVTKLGGPYVSPPLSPGYPAEWLSFGDDIGHVDGPQPPFPYEPPLPPYPNDIPAPAEPGSGALALLVAGAAVYARRARTPA